MLKHEEKTESLATISRILSQFNLRLMEIEDQLAALQGKNIVYDERKVPERIGELGSTTISKIGSGEGLQELLREPFCDCCRVALKSEFALCKCGRKVCLATCAILWEGATLCPACVRERLSISKKTFKVLWAVNFGITDTNTIKKLSKMINSDINTGFAELFQLGYIVRDGFWRNARITDDGIIALELCYKVYSKDVDCTYYEQALRSEIS